MDRNTQALDKLRPQITSEAADWFARLQGLDVNGADRDEFSKWLLRSPAHIEEYLAVTRIWGDAEFLKDISADELIRQAREHSEPDNVVALEQTLTPALSQRERESNAAPSPRVRGEGRGEGLFRFRTFAVAATLLVMLAAGSFIAKQWLYPSRIVTEIGEQRSVTLRDGSVVHLNTDSDVRIELGDKERRITLARGEVRFTVAKDPTRPFLVSTRQATVRAMGTVFNVQASDDRTAVTVIEGKVAFSSRAEPRIAQSPPQSQSPTATPPAPKQIQLVAGEHAAITEEGAIIPNSGPTVEHALAWSERRLVFRDDALADVVAEFNRYHERPIRIEDPQLAALRISGTFYAGDPQSLIQYLERYEQVQVRESADGSKILATH